MSSQIEKDGANGTPLVKSAGMFRAWLHPQVAALFFLGFSAGLPLLLIFSTLSVWLREAGVERASVTFFSWAALAYSFKFIWSPLIDKMPVPMLTKRLGRRRAWLLVAQMGIIIAIVWMGCTDPARNGNVLVVMAMAAVLLGFSSATQDIVIDAYRIECIETSMQALLASAYVAGYRIGMLVAGAGSLYLATYFGTSREQYHFEAWRMTYLVMALFMSVGLLTTLRISEPARTGIIDRYQYSTQRYLRFLLLFLLVALAFATSFFFSASLVLSVKESLNRQLHLHDELIGFVVEACRFLMALTAAAVVARGIVLIGIVDREMVSDTYVAPLRDFFDRYGLRTALLLLTLVGFYRISDIVLGVVSNVFYIDMGFSKNVIATVTKTFGLIMTLIGGFVGGMLTVRFGVYRILFTGALLSVCANLLFMLLARSGSDLTLLTVVIGADNLCTGLASTAFIAFLSSLTSVSFTAVQYALFSSVMTLFPKLIGGYSGTLVESMGYEHFFFLTACMGLPVLLLVWLSRGVISSEKS